MLFNISSVYTRTRTLFGLTPRHTILSKFIITENGLAMFVRLLKKVSFLSFTNVFKTAMELWTLVFVWTSRTNLERGIFVEEARVVIDKPSQLSAIQEKHQQKKLLESKLAQLFYVTCE